MARDVWVVRGSSRVCPACGGSRVEPTVTVDDAVVYPAEDYESFVAGEGVLSPARAERVAVCELTCLSCGEMWNVDEDGDVIEVFRLQVRKMVKK